MSESFHWRCPYCDRDTTITYNRYHSDKIRLEIENADGPRELHCHFIVCPNEKCKKFTLTACLYESIEKFKGSYSRGKCLQIWNLIPPSQAKTYPDFIPKPIISDYQEACLVKDLSPKSLCYIIEKMSAGNHKEACGQAEPACQPARAARRPRGVLARLDGAAGPRSGSPAPPRGRGLRSLRSPLARPGSPTPSWRPRGCKRVPRRSAPVSGSRRRALSGPRTR